MAQLMLVMAIVSAAGAVSGGIAQKHAADAEAQQLEMNANQTVAASQRQAYVDRQKTKAVQSRQQALAAASGTTSTDTGVVNLLGETQREGEYAALSDLFSGQSDAQAKRYQAQVTRTTGQQAQTAGLIDAAGTLAGNGQVSGMFSKYAGQVPSWFGAGSPGYGASGTAFPSGALAFMG